MAIFSFLSLSLFVLFGSLAYMEPIGQHWQTWEDIAGFGRKNKVQTLHLLIALASIAGLPGTLGYFIKLSLIAPMQDNLLFSGTIFISIAFGAACTMRMFVFLFSKQSTRVYAEINDLPPYSLMASALILIALGLFPFVR
jgi:NADH:ubiquinone oxidoreductase subunit 2 (subunit N)